MCKSAVRAVNMSKQASNWYMHKQSEACWQHQHMLTVCLYQRGCETHNSNIGMNDMADCTAVLLTELHKTQATAYAVCSIYMTECQQP